MRRSRRRRSRRAGLRYFIKCIACDSVFWLDRADAPTPEHGPWNRRQERRPSAETGCPGSGFPGHWIGEDEEGGAITGSSRPDPMRPDTSPES